MIRMKSKKKSFLNSFENFISQEQAKRKEEDHFLIYQLSPDFNDLDDFNKELVKKILFTEIFGD